MGSVSDSKIQQVATNLKVATLKKALDKATQYERQTRLKFS